VPGGVGDGFKGGMNAQLFEDILDVLSDGGWADDQGLGYGRWVRSLGKEAQHLPLPRGEGLWADWCVRRGVWPYPLGNGKVLYKGCETLDKFLRFVLSGNLPEDVDDGTKASHV